MTTAIEKYNGAELLRSATNPMDAVKELGRMFAGSGMFGLKTPEQGAIFAMTCLMENKTPMEIMRTYHIIQGRPSMRADAMQAEFLRAGGRIRWDVSTDDECTITLTHPEYAPEGVQVTEERAKYEAGGVTRGKDTWKIYPRRMLQCRAISAGIRQVMPQIVAGIYTPEEMADAVDVSYEAAEPEPQRQPDPQPKAALPPAKPTSSLDAYRDKAETTFAGMGISLQRLEAKCGTKSSWGKAELARLKSARERIESGQSTADAEFPPLAEAAAQREVAEVAASLERYGVIRDDLERWMGTTWDPPIDPVPVASWTKTELAKAQWAAQEIIEAPDPMARALELFDLEPGA